MGSTLSNEPSSFASSDVCEHSDSPVSFKSGVQKHFGFLAPRKEEKGKQYADADELEPTALFPASSIVV